jgi:5-methylcytosine-specific restriction protein A
MSSADLLPFIPNQIYRRSEIHDQFGGTRQGGIATCAKFPFIFIFTDKSGKQHGYNDAWENKDIFSYTGEGQVGDMKFVKGNLALREHLNNKKRVFLFESVKKTFVRFICELAVFDFDFFMGLDRENKLRQAIRFFLKRPLSIIPYKIGELRQSSLLQDSTLSEIIPIITERKGLVTTRVGQDAYRKSIIHRWEWKCAVTKFDDLRILIASHIAPWKNATDIERLDVNNGILLSPVYDALFDRHLISFNERGQIILSEQIDQSAYRKIGVTGKEVIHNFSIENEYYLKNHRETFNKII